MRDIESRKEIDQFVDEFYKKAMKDPVIGHFFTEVVRLDLEKHLPLIGDFWESVLLRNDVYHRNPMSVHLALNRKSRMTRQHFDRWLELFNLTIDSLFEGENARIAKERALSIATVMQIKIASDATDN